MNFLESFKVAIGSIMSNKMRSFLTMLGIIIGISSVITIVSLGKGGQGAITGEFEKIGVNLLEVKVDTNTNLNKDDYFTMKDVKNINERISDVKNAAPIFQTTGQIKTGKYTKTAVIVGTNNDYTSVTTLNILYGRFINNKDVLLGNNVILIDNLSAKKLFGYEDCTGKTVKVGNGSSTVNATIIGVFKNESEPYATSFAESMPIYIYCPITFTEKLFSNNFNIGQIEVSINSNKNLEAASSNIVKLLETTHHNKDKYKAESIMKQLEQVNNILNIFTMIIGAIAGISLLVGGIGVMNIMLVSVTERTREIGIRKAIGATRKDILVQFLIESVIISLIGGVIGMLLGVFAAYGIGSVIKVTPSVSITTILIAFAFSSGVGIFFGIYPANKASKLDPIEALRYE